MKSLTRKISSSQHPMAILYTQVSVLINTECHNKLIILISMWIDSNNNKLSNQYCFTAFGRLGPYNQKYPVAWVLGSNVPEDKQKFIRAWMDFLDSIDNEENLKKINFNFNVKN